MSKNTVSAEVIVYEEDVAFIDSLKLSHSHNKVVFSLIVVNRLYGNNFYINNKQKLNKKLENMSTLMLEDSYKKAKREQTRGFYMRNLLNDLIDYQIVETYSDKEIATSFSHQLVNELLTIKIPEKSGFYYDYIYDRNHIKMCSICETPIQYKTNRKKYCDDCRNMINRIRRKEYARNKRGVKIKNG